MNTLRVVTIVLIILVAIIAAISIYSDTPYRMMESNFKNTSPIPNIKTSNVTEKWQDQYALPDFQVGGVLANNFALNWFQDFIKKGEVTFQGTAVCAHRTRKSCTAYSLLRSDLIPVLFEYPKAGQSVPCGIILDPTKAWPLITGMLVNDGDTNARVCCSNESEGRDQPLNCGSHTIDFSPGNRGSGMDLCGLNDCNGNRTCMMLQSGGSINAYKLEQIRSLCSQEGTDFSRSKLCAQPYVCVMENAPKNSQDVRNTDTTNEANYKIVEETDRIANYIGKDGEGYIPLLNADCPSAGVDKKGDGSGQCSYNGRGGKNINDGISHCKFKREDWDYWIKTLKRVYNEYEKRFPTNKYEGVYIENEVNLYVNPNNGDEAFIQQKLFENAIIGFYYNNTNCDQQLKWLTPQKTTEGRNGSTRCDDYFQDILTDPFLNKDKNITGTSTVVTRKQRQSWENLMIQISRQLVHQVADLFEKQTSRKVPVYKCTASSNAFMNYDEVRQAQNNNIKLSSIFQKDTDYLYSAEIQKYVDKKWEIQA